jgi:hypothetical protein
MTTETWHMSATEQSGSLAIMFVVVACIVAGLWLVVRDVRGGWNVDDFEADYFTGRDMHLNDIRDAMRAARVSSR